MPTLEDFLLTLADYCHHKATWKDVLVDEAGESREKVWHTGETVFNWIEKTKES